MGDTTDEVRDRLTRFVDAEFPPEMEIAKRLQGTLKDTDRNLADPDGSRDALLVIMLMAIVELESELRGPKSHKFVVDLPERG